MRLDEDTYSISHLSFEKCVGGGGGLAKVRGGIDLQESRGIVGRFENWGLGVNSLIKFDFIASSLRTYVPKET